ncbi:MAG: hypothetical protein ABL896_05410, partial [Hylemonella sp.]
RQRQDGCAQKLTLFHVRLLNRFYDFTHPIRWHAEETSIAKVHYFRLKPDHAQVKFQTDRYSSLKYLNRSHPKKK